METELTVKVTAPTKGQAFNKLRKALHEAEMKGIGVTRLEFCSESGADVNLRTLRPPTAPTLGAAVGASLATPPYGFEQAPINLETESLQDPERRAMADPCLPS